MSRSGALEHRYRRLLMLYPRAFRRDSAEEILAVLMSGAGEDRRWPGLTDSVDLIRSATWMRLCPGTPRSAPHVRWAVRLMCLAAALELSTLVTTLATLGGLRATLAHAFPAWTAAHLHHVVLAESVSIEVAAPVAAGLWLWLAWASRRGSRWPRVGVALLFALLTLSLLSAVAGDAAAYAPADLFVGAALWLVALAALVLVLDTASLYHRREPAHC